MPPCPLVSALISLKCPVEIYNVLILIQEVALYQGENALVPLPLQKQRLRKDCVLCLGGFILYCNLQTACLNLSIQPVIF